MGIVVARFTKGFLIVLVMLMAIPAFAQAPYDVALSFPAEQGVYLVPVSPAVFVPSKTIKRPLPSYLEARRAEYIGYVRSLIADDRMLELVDEVIIAESGYQKDAKNPASTASGLGQFLNGTFDAYCIKRFGFAESMEQKNDPYIQLRCMTKMILDGGIGHWKASEHIWGPRVSWWK